MVTQKSEEKTRTVELLEKILIFQLYALGVPQLRIAKIVKKKTNWVNELVKGISKTGK